mgnify:CR=1 FL=1
MDIQAVAFSGHRPKKFPWKYDESSPECAALRAVIAERIDGFVNAGIVHFLSGMALGVDLWCAKSVLDIRKRTHAVKLHCILPCVSQPDEWSDAAQEEYWSVLKEADSVYYVSREYHKNCMLERNRFLVDHATILLAVYNGERRGGTAATVRYARAKGKEIFTLAPATLCLTHETSQADNLLLGKKDI